MTGRQLCEAAGSLIGTPFRLNGRDAQSGVDCLGLIIVALRKAGHPVADPRDYRLRQRTVDHLMPFARRNGFEPHLGITVPGDLLLFALPGLQHHVALAADQGRIIHAHAGLRRVVEGQADPNWIAVATWRFASETME